MTARAYDSEYLPLAQRVMGDMFDFAINEMGIGADWFADLSLRRTYRGR